MRETNYGALIEALEKRTDGISSVIANLANAAAILFNGMHAVNWAGFYLMENGALVLGPFQGKPAVVNIAVGSGVCGTAVAEDRVQLVRDVHTCCNHIACDPASSSEIVLPIYKDGVIFGVLDMDSPFPGRFDEADQAGLEAFCRVLEKHI